MSGSDHFVLEDVKALLAMLNSVPPAAELVCAEQRMAYRMLKQMTEADPRELATVRDLSCPGPAGDIPIRFYDARPAREPSPVVLHFHGGGFVIGDLETHHALCSELAAELDLPVVSVDYRLAPEHPFPAAPDDCEAVARWVASSPAELNRDVKGLITIGGSAGGNLAAVTSRALADKPAAVPVKLQVLLYPATEEIWDGSMQTFAEGHLLTKKAMEWFYSLYLPESGNPRAFPLLATAEGMPPTIMAVGGLDPLQDQARRYAAKLAEAGVNVTTLNFPGLTHDFTTTRKALPSAQAATARVIAAMRLMLAG